MNRIYKFFGGRKVFFFLLLLGLNTYLKESGNWSTEFGSFGIWLYAVVVLGFEGNKLVKSKYPKQNKDL